MPDILYLMAFPEAPPLGPIKELDYVRDLHLTILPNFAIAKNNLDELILNFERISNWFTEPIVAAHDFEELGSIVKIPAALVENTTGDYELRELHESFVEAVHQLGGHFAQYQFIEESFKPHVSYWHGIGSMKLECISLMQHTEGFGRGVVNLANYFLTKTNNSQSFL